MTTPGPAPEPAELGVVVVDHGSRRAESNRLHEESVEAWGRGAPYRTVQAAHMELAEPSIATAFDRCVEAGATAVVIAPYFLGPGNHWDRDIPALASRAAARHPGIRHLVAAPLGPHPLLFEVVDRRVQGCLAHATSGGPPCELCGNSGRCRLS